MEPDNSNAQSEGTPSSAASTLEAHHSLSKGAEAAATAEMDQGQQPLVENAPGGTGTVNVDAPPSKEASAEPATPPVAAVNDSGAEASAANAQATTGPGAPVESIGRNEEAPESSPLATVLEEQAAGDSTSNAAAADAGPGPRAAVDQLEQAVSTSEQTDVAGSGSGGGEGGCPSASGAAAVEVPPSEGSESAAGAGAADLGGEAVAADAAEGAGAGAADAAAGAGAADAAAAPSPEVNRTAEEGAGDPSLQPAAEPRESLEASMRRQEGERLQYELRRMEVHGVLDDSTYRELSARIAADEEADGDGYRSGLLLPTCSNRRHHALWGSGLGSSMDAKSSRQRAEVTHLAPSEAASRAAASAVAAEGTGTDSAAGAVGPDAASEDAKDAVEVGNSAKSAAVRAVGTAGGRSRLRTFEIMPRRMGSAGVMSAYHGEVPLGMGTAEAASGGWQVGGGVSSSGQVPSDDKGYESGHDGGRGRTRAVGGKGTAGGSDGEEEVEFVMLPTLPDPHPVEAEAPKVAPSKNDSRGRGRSRGRGGVGGDKDADDSHRGGDAKGYDSSGGGGRGGAAYRDDSDEDSGAEGKHGGGRGSRSSDRDYNHRGRDDKPASDSWSSGPGSRSGYK